MYVRNLLRAGDYVEMVPVGIPVKLLYNQYLEKVFLYHGDNQIDATDRLLAAAKKSNSVPNPINIVEGTTWVSGVFYTRRIFSEQSGSLPECVIDDMIDAFNESPNSFTFYAGAVSSLGASFRGAIPARRWLEMNQFKLLPGWIIPSNLTKETLYKMVGTGQFPFTLPLISEYIVYRDSDLLYFSTGIKQNTCKKVTKNIDRNGFLHGIIDCGDKTINVNYSDIVSNNIYSNTLVVQDMYGSIIFTHHPSGGSYQVPRNISCPACGKKYLVPMSGPTCCDDPDCSSFLYRKMVQFCNVLKIPDFEYDTFQKMIKDGEVSSILDILNIEPISTFKIKATIPTLLRAIVPMLDVGDSSIFSQISNNCNNSIETVEYYLKNPEKLSTDFHLEGISFNKFVSWASRIENLHDVVKLLHSPNVTVMVVDKKFDGPAIFRNKTILLTGKFRHGDFNEVASILQSYSAKVVFEFSESVDCLVVGDFMESTNGQFVRNCKQLNIPVFEESKFFRMYDIDNDLKSNLN